MKDSFQFITDHYGKLTKNEKCVADYMISDFESAIHMTVSELSKKCGVGHATPVRLAKHMGFDGYAAFRLYLAKCAPKREDDFLDMDKDSLRGDSPAKKLLKAEMESIRLTMEEIDYEALKTISKKIHLADSVLFFGSGTSYLAATDAAYKFMRVGKSVFYTDSAEQAAVLSSAFSKNSLVMIISHSGEHSGACSVLALAKELGISSCVFTAFPDSTAASFADVTVKTQTRESPLHKIAFTSRISQLAAVDALFMTYYSTYHDSASKKLTLAVSNVELLKKHKKA